MRFAYLLLTAMTFGTAQGASQDETDVPPTDPPFDLAQIMAQSYGLSRSEVPGELWGGGPDYKVQFTPRGWVFTAALGDAVERAPSLTFELETIWRGGQLICDASAPTTAVAENDDVSYALAPGISAHYAVQREGIEQSFLFKDPLPGRGDLVVRGSLHSEFPLPRTGESHNGFDFVLPGIGGIHYGGVTGVDAKGKSIPGRLCFDGSFLDLILPGDFVDQAAYPLTLDPLIGSKIVISGPTQADSRRPDAAYDASNGRYLVVWERNFGTYDLDIRGQMVTASGSLAGGLIYIETTNGNYCTKPCVANCNPSDEFLVAWQQSSSITAQADIVCRAVTASNGALSAQVTVAGTAIHEQSPDIGGEATQADNEVLVVYTQGNAIGDYKIIAKQVTVSVSSPPDPLVVSSTTLSYHPKDWNVAISKSGGSTGKYLVVWQRSNAAPPEYDLDHDILYTVIDRNGNIVTGNWWSITIGPDEVNPDVDGDGTRWMIAYERGASAYTSNYDIYCRSVELNGSTLSTISQTKLTLGGDDNEANPAIGYTGEEYVMAWEDEGSGQHPDTAVVGLDPFSGAILEGFQYLDNSTSADAEPEIATQYSGGSSGDDALIVWQSVDLATINGAIDAQRYETNAGQSTDLGGGGERGGRAFASGAMLGNQGFVHRVRGAVPKAGAYLMLGFAQLPASFAGCTLVLDPGSSLLLAAGHTDVDGHAALPMAIPSNPALLGLTFNDQWALVVDSPSCSGVGAELSNAISVKIQ